MAIIKSNNYIKTTVNHPKNFEPKTVGRSQTSAANTATVNFILKHPALYDVMKIKNFNTI